MWMLFVVGIITQFIPITASILGRVFTILLFLLISFRIYNGYTNDFSILPSDSLAEKFAIFAGIYFAGALAMCAGERFKKYTQYLSILLAVTAGYQGYTLVQEMRNQSKTQFQTNNPEYILLTDYESKRYVERLRDAYETATSKNAGLVSHQTSQDIDGYSYRIVFSDGSGQNMLPIFSIEQSMSDTIKVRSLFFRYEPDLYYGFIHYQTYLPEKQSILDEETARAFLEENLDKIEEILQK